MKFTGQPARILDFDCEARPLSYLGQDFTTRELTAIAAQFIGEKKIYCWALGESSPKEMLEGFRALYDRADIVTGHFIRSYDLPLIQATLLEHGLPSLGPKMTCDTKSDLIKFQGISKSQESLGAMLGLKHPKIGMNQTDWRTANRLTEEGIQRTKRRVKGDVVQHVELRAELLRRNMLKPPRRWTP